MLKVLLVNPRSKIFSYNVPPLGILYIAAMLQAKGSFDIYVKDINMEELDEARDIFREINPDIVGVTALAFTYKYALGILKLAKQLNPWVFTVMGGIHPTNLPDECIKQECCDCVVVGEGEFTFVELCEARAEKKELNNIDGIIFKKDSLPIRNIPRKMIVNLDAIRFPAYQYTDISQYTVSLHHMLFTRAKFGEIILPIIGSRGCFHKCAFCNLDVWGNRIRLRSPENIVTEIKYLIEKYNVRRFHFLDALFTADFQHTKRLCELIIEKGIKIKWFCGTRLDLINAEILSLMKDAGCDLIVYGTESGSQLILDSLNKNISVSKMQEALSLTQKTGMKSYGNFIIGAPGENKKTVCETISFAKKYLDMASFTVALIFPCTGLAQKLGQAGKRVFKEWDRFSFKEIPKIAYIPEGMDYRLLQNYILKAYIAFYLSPRIMLGVLKKIAASGRFLFFIKHILKAALSLTTALAFKCEGER